MGRGGEGKRREGEIKGEGERGSRGTGQGRGDRQQRIFKATCLAHVYSQQELGASVLPLDLGYPQLPPNTEGIPLVKYHFYIKS